MGRKGIVDEEDLEMMVEEEEDVEEGDGGRGYEGKGGLMRTWRIWLGRLK